MGCAEDDWPGDEAAGEVAEEEWLFEGILGSVTANVTRHDTLTDTYAAAATAAAASSAAVSPQTQQQHAAKQQQQPPNRL